MSTSAKPLVLVIGGTGRTGQPVLNALIEYRAFRVETLVRPESASKPEVESLKSIGVEIRLGNFVTDTVEKLVEILAGVDILVSVVNYKATLDQKNVIKAAKQAGVKRVIPCDFGTASVPGRMMLHDQKLVIRNFIKELGVPYTFIDVGFWHQLVLPQPSAVKSPLSDLSHEVFGSGDVKTAVTNLTDIGRFLARIIQDPRTINQYVFCWSDHVSQNEIYNIAERVAGERFSESKVHIPEPSRLAAEYRAKYERGEGDFLELLRIWYEYAESLYIQGDNTVEKAKSQGALDARELYPNFKPLALEESAKTFYATAQ